MFTVTPRFPWASKVLPFGIVVEVSYAIVNITLGLPADCPLYYPFLIHHV